VSGRRIWKEAFLLSCEHRLSSQFGEGGRVDYKGIKERSSVIT
jgi:hypothetical protein